MQHEKVSLSIRTWYEDLLAKGRARPHRAGVKGYISYPMQDPEDVAVVIEILGRNYDRAKTAAESVARSRAASQRDTEDEA